MIDEKRRAEIDRFVHDSIDSVPQLEALLLLFNSSPREWRVEEMARSLYIRPEQATRTLEGLEHAGLVSASPVQAGAFLYAQDDGERDRMLADLDAVYRREIVRISSLIHSKASAGVRDFARAFRFKKDKD